MTTPAHNEATAILTVITDVDAVGQFADALTSLPPEIAAAGAPIVAAINSLGQQMTPAMAQVGARAAAALETSLNAGLANVRRQIEAIRGELATAEAGLAFTRAKGAEGLPIYNSPRFQIEKADRNSYFGTDKMTGERFGGSDTTLRQAKETAARILTQDTQDLHRMQQQLQVQVAALSRAYQTSQPLTTGLQSLPRYMRQELPAGTMTPPIDFTRLEAQAARVAQIMPRFQAVMDQLKFFSTGRINITRPGSATSLPSWVYEVTSATSFANPSPLRVPGMARFRREAEDLNDNKIAQEFGGYRFREGREGQFADNLYTRIIRGGEIPKRAGSTLTPEFLKYLTGSMEMSRSRTNSAISTNIGLVTPEQLRDEWVAANTDPDEFRPDRQKPWQIANRNQLPVVRPDYSTDVAWRTGYRPPSSERSGVFASDPQSATAFREQVAQETARAIREMRGAASAQEDAEAQQRMFYRNLFPSAYEQRFGALGPTSAWVPPEARGLSAITAGNGSQNLPAVLAGMTRAFPQWATHPDPLADLRAPTDNERSAHAAAATAKEAVTVWERLEALVRATAGNLAALGYDHSGTARNIGQLSSVAQGGDPRDVDRLIEQVKALRNTAGTALNDHVTGSNTEFALGDNLGQLRRMETELTNVRNGVRLTALEYEEFARKVKSARGDDPFGGKAQRARGGIYTAGEYNNDQMLLAYERYIGAGSNVNGSWNTGRGNRFLNSLTGSPVNSRPALPPGTPLPSGYGLPDGGGAGNGGGGGRIPPAGGAMGDDFDPNRPGAKHRAQKEAARPMWNSAFPNGVQPSQGQGTFGRGVDFLMGGLGNLGGFFKYFASLSGAIMLFDGITRGLHAAVTEALAFNAASIELNSNLNGTSAAGGSAADALGNYAAAAGFAPSKGVEAGTIGLQVYGQQVDGGANKRDVASVTSETALQGSRIASFTGAPVDANVVAQQLGAITNAYNLNFRDQGAILNQAVVAHEKYGLSVKDVLAGSAQLAAAAEKAKMPVGILVQTVGAVGARLGRTGTAVAGELSRDLLGAGSAQVQNALAMAGVSRSGNTYADFAELAKLLPKMSEGRQNQVYTAVGGRRSSALGVFLDQLRTIQDNSAEAFANPTRGLDEFDRAMKSALGVLSNFGSTLRNLGKDIAGSGLLDPFFVLIKLMTPILSLADKLLQVFNEMPHGIGQVAVALGEVAVLAKVIKSSFGIDLVGGLAGPMLPGRGWVSNEKRAATAATTAAASSASIGAQAAAGDALLAAQLKRAQAEARLATIENEFGSNTAEAAAARLAANRADQQVVAAEADFNAATVAATEARLAAATAAKRAGLAGDTVLLGGGTAGTRTAAAAERAASAEMLMLTAGPGPARFVSDGTTVRDTTRRWERSQNMFIPGSASRWQRNAGVTNGALIAEGEANAASTGVSRLGGAMAGLSRFAGPAVIGLVGLTSAISYLHGQATKMQQDAEAAASSSTLATASAYTQKDRKQALVDTANAIIDESQASNPSGGVVTSLINKLTGGGSKNNSKQIQSLEKQYRDLVNTSAKPDSTLSTDDVYNTLAGSFGDLSTQDAIKTGLSVLTQAGVGAEGQSIALQRALKNTPKEKLTPLTLQDYATNQSALSTSIGTAVGARTGIAVQGDFAAQKNQRETIQTMLDQGYKRDDPRMQQVQSVMDTIDNQTNADLHSRYDALAKRDASNRKSDDVIGRLNDQIHGVVLSMSSDKVDSDQYVADQTAYADLLQQRTKAQLAVAGAQALAKIDPRNTLTLARQQMQNDIASLATMDPTSAEYATTQARIAQEGQQTYTQGRDLAATARSSQIDPRNTVALSKVALDRAREQYLHDRDTQAGPAAYQAYQQALIAYQTGGDTLRGQQLQARDNPLFTGQGTNTARINAYGNLQRAKGTEAEAAAQIAANQANAADAQNRMQTRIVTYQSNLDPGSSTDAAAGQLYAAQQQLALYASDKSSLEYRQALIAFHQAQIAVAQNAVQVAQVARSLTGDITDPVFNARNALLAANDQLTRDKAAHRAPDVINADKANVRSAQASAEDAAFQQRMSDAQIADSLGRTSHQAYLQYLENEHNRLVAITHRTRQQQNELDQVDQAIKAANDQLAGQFNLGDIKIPTVYDVRRQVAAQTAGLSGAYDNRVTTINVNGADFARVVQYLQGALGAPGASRVNVTASPGGI